MQKDKDFPNNIFCNDTAIGWLEVNFISKHSWNAIRDHLAFQPPFIMILLSSQIHVKVSIMVWKLYHNSVPLETTSRKFHHIFI